MANNAMQLQSWIEKYSNKYGVDPDFARAVLSKESSGNSTAVSDKGAVGYMQVMPGTFKEMLPNGNINDPENNVEAGVKYLSILHNQTGGNYADTLGSYNAGFTGFSNMKKKGSYADETVNYVNDPRFQKWVGDQRIEQVANPLKNKIKANSFTPEQLNRSALKNTTNEAEALSQSAGMQPQDTDNTNVINQKQTNPLLTTQQQYQNELNQQKLAAAAEEANRKKQAYQQMGYMVLGAILGKNVNNTESVSGAGIPKFKGSDQPLQGYGDKNLANFQITSGGSR
ncbi:MULTISPECIES: lytic transglycosylase domain-containing protein [Enterobacter cloacae complex]|uniref:lytic transglycosylase domain-containing protein n=1 Tax=Enterobacter cloacae complex TaxID=354276 RepID=UPI0010109157|nr:MULTISPECIES: lytic transglycosylase domain-containing protein [Enterobacter cloacae complex]MDQ6584443.1 lytic transglycosylase domain-containing protein [Enterobacter hormaechei]RYA41446.1 hypothetical protein DD603_13055 [Enterobacter cloacae complex sp. 2DZ2F2B]RYA45728.1 hypothetical protein DD605_06375 [Enterobacter cloacae complex sp. 3DZ3S2B]